MNKKVIALFCGSFNPPLNSHFSLAEELINEDKNIEKIIFVPVSNKYNKTSLIEDYHRYKMLKLVCDKNSKFEVSDIELQTERQPYTIETMEKVQEEYSEYEIRLIIGTDNLRELETWHKIENLLNQFKIIVLARDEDNINEIIEKDKFLAKYKDKFLIPNISIRTNLSSTFVREQIKKGKQINFLLPEEIRQYIEKNNLYK